MAEKRAGGERAGERGRQRETETGETWLCLRCCGIHPSVVGCVWGVEGCGREVGFWNGERCDGGGRRGSAGCGGRRGGAGGEAAPLGGGDEDEEAEEEEESCRC